MMKRNPAGARRGIEQGVEYRPVRDRIAAVFHGFRFAIRRGYGPAIQVIAADDDRRSDFAGFHEMIDSLAKLGALAITQPANARGQTLEMHLCASKANPSTQDIIFRKEIQHE